MSLGVHFSATLYYCFEIREFYQARLSYSDILAVEFKSAQWVILFACFRILIDQLTHLYSRQLQAPDPSFPFVLLFSCATVKRDSLLTEVFTLDHPR